jgi:peroxiredoxin
VASACAAAVLGVAAASALALDVGDKAPELNVSGWASGDPVKLADGAGSKVWLVVFWGTFDSDCVEAMPALNKTLEAHKAAGLDIVAVTTEPAEIVKRYLEEHKLDYHVALDQFHATRDAYAGKQKKLPVGWLVDKTGTVVWSGNPTWGMDSVLEQVLSGKFDMKKAKELESRQSDFWNALFANDWDALAALSDKVLEIDPTDGQAFTFRVLVYQQKHDVDGYRKFMKTHVEKVKDDAGALSRAARQLGLEDGYEWRDLELAHATAKRAVEVSKTPNADAIETYAQILFTIGMVEQAIEQEKKAVAADDKDEDHKHLLAWYEACLAAKKKAAAPTPPPKKK